MALQLGALHNTYFGMRHGKSVANEEQIIVSNPAHGVPGYGLSEEGKEQVRASAEKAKKENILDDSIVIVSSDFARARETAEMTAQILGSKNITLDARLRERFFGDWDKTANSNYKKVWSADREDHTHTENGVESVEDVLKRTTSLIEELEKKHSGQKVLLVSHGDTLQILNTAFREVHPSDHPDLKLLETAEIRPFTQIWQS